MMSDRVKQLTLPANTVGGMSPDAHQTYTSQINALSKTEFGVGEKKIIIPSFETTGKLFAQHFQILRELKHQIDQLKKAYDKQRSEIRSWDQIDKILNVLNTATFYLNFPDEVNLDE